MEKGINLQGFRSELHDDFGKMVMMRLAFTMNDGPTPS